MMLVNDMEDASAQMYGIDIIDILEYKRKAYVLKLEQGMPKEVLGFFEVFVDADDEIGIQNAKKHGLRLAVDKRTKRVVGYSPLPESMDRDELYRQIVGHLIIGRVVS